MYATTSAMRSGLYAQEITGIGLNSTGRQTVRGLLASAEALAQAIREAMARARSTGLDAFAPDSATLQATGLSSADLLQWRKLFAEVIGHPYSAADRASYPSLPDHGALTLEQWSQAVQALEVEVARQGSELPPGEGGGMRHALGQWYVNGERYTLAELFLTVRMGNVTATDMALETDLNTLLANTNLARTLLAVLADMKRQRDLLVASRVPNDPEFLPKEHFADFVKKAGLSVDDINKYGRQFKGDNSYLSKFKFTAGTGGAPDLCLYVPEPISAPTRVLTTVTLAEYGYTMDELQALFDSLNAENQVKRLKVQSVQNARTAVLEGMSAFLSSTSDQNSKVGRNL